MSIWRTKSIEMIKAESEKKELVRTMGPLELVGLGIGAIVGTGIFVLTGVAAANYAGPAVILSFVLAGIAAGLAALVYAEMAAMIPASGSAYTFTIASLGEITAWLVGWNLILEYMVAAGAVAIGWGSYLNDLMRSINVVIPHAWVTSPLAGGIVNLPAVIITLLITALAIVGTRQSATFNKAIVAIKLLVIFLFLLLGFNKINPTNWTPFTPFGLGGIARGAAIIFFAYIGFDAVATAAEEVKQPKRDLPIGIIGSLLVSTILYILVSATLTGMVRYTQLNTASPVAEALLLTGIRLGSAFISVGALAGLTSVLLVAIYAQSRIFFAMSRDGLLPPMFKKLHPRFRTPYLNTALIGVVVSAAAGILPIGLIAELANIGTLTAFITVSIALLVLRKTKPELERPFRLPLVPWIPLGSIVFAMFLILNLPPLTWIRFVVWIVVGLAIYFFYGQHHSVLTVRNKDMMMVPGLLEKVLPDPVTKRLDDKDEG
ncbi:MAG: amino acid permease [Bacillota bacterium]